MLKKMVVLAVVGFVAVAALSGTKLMSHLRSIKDSVQQQVDDSVTPEQEIKRLKNEVKLLDEDAKQLLKQLAKERVEVESLKTKTDELTEKQAKEKARLLARGEEIKKKETQIAAGTQDARNLATAKADLEADVKRFGIAQKTLASHEELLAKRIKVRDSMEKQFETTKAQKAELTNAIADLEAQIALLNLQQAESKYQTDDTRLAKIKEDLRALGKKINVKREELKLTETLADDRPATQPTSAKGDKSVDDILADLNGPAKKND
ncbi:MAG: hypothetical protein K2V38_19675 [Gemmataceae bacterium]|nr:hypothetical protein [Gemmataceae bacterium]